MNTLLSVKPLSENMFLTPENYLICRGVPIARTGVQYYSTSEGLTDVDGKPLADLNGVIAVTKPERVLFDKSTIASFEGKPVTIGHTMVTPDNWKDAAIGTAFNVRRGEGLLKNNLLADLMITDSNAIELIKSGTIREISLGYEASYLSDGKGRAEQTSITGNHIAVVKLGKAGHLCRIYDSVTDNIKAEFMNLKEMIKKTFCNQIDEVNTFDELIDLQGEAQKLVEPASEQEAKDASTKNENKIEDPKDNKEALTSDELPPAANAANPAITAAQPQQAQTAVEQLMSKLDQILAIAQKLEDTLTAAESTTDAQENEAEPAQEKKPVMINLDPNKTMRN